MKTFSENLQVPLSPNELNSDLQAMRDALSTLEEKAQLAIYFRFWESMTIQQIGKVLGLSWDATDQLIKKSLSYLRDQIEFARKNNGLQRAA